MKITAALASASLSLVPLTAQAHADTADHHDLTMVLIGMDMNMGMSMGVAAALTASVLLVRMAWRKQPRVSASTKAAT